MREAGGALRSIGRLVEEEGVRVEREKQEKGTTKRTKNNNERTHHDLRGTG